MITTFLRRPHGAELAADALRILGAVSIVVAGIGWGPLAALTVSLAVFASLFPRLLGVRPSVDLAFGVAVLVSAWSSVLEVYLTTRWWDIPTHFVTNGLTAALLYLLLVRTGVIADAAALRHPFASAVLLTTALGLSLGVLWEVAEWFGHTYVDETIYVGYSDSIGDLVVGGAGALLAGCTMRFLAGASRFTEGPRQSVAAR
ncbi:hypothetical protein J2X63_002674 [Agromyces sp. 3263]|uniref:hypothetical protein n=1 Tax=Agromyces sp. 3263 TaxID=2817750 RepID=UPI002866B2A4|nr:hypothetical protein [Agromyces sp. 3263]MDR6906966.1 hypothetical protein [Agromyces sp. 3263]